MARWRLTQPHYLNVPGTEWEYKETDRNTGRQGRKVFFVPLYLHPDDPGSQNYPPDVIVANRSQGRDIVFVGPPTPDMEPLDDEARAISDHESPKWVHPIESLPGQGYSQSLLESLEQQVAALAANKPATPAPAVSAASIDPEDFAKLQEQVAALMAQNAELQSKLTRRV